MVGTLMVAPAWVTVHYTTLANLRCLKHASAHYLGLKLVEFEENVWIPYSYVFNKSDVWNKRIGRKNLPKMFKVQSWIISKSSDTTHTVSVNHFRIQGPSVTVRASWPLKPLYYLPDNCKTNKADRGWFGLVKFDLKRLYLKMGFT